MKLNKLKILFIVLGLLSTYVYGITWGLTQSDILWVIINFFISLVWIILLFSPWLPEIKFSWTRSIIGAFLILSAFIIFAYSWVLTKIDPFSSALFYVETYSWVSFDTLIYPFLFGLMLLLTDPRDWPIWFWLALLFPSFFWASDIMVDAFAVLTKGCPIPKRLSAPPCVFDIDFGAGNQYKYNFLLFFLDNAWQLTVVVTTVYSLFINNIKKLTRLDQSPRNIYELLDSLK